MPALGGKGPEDVSMYPNLFAALIRCGFSDDLVCEKDRQTQYYSSSPGEGQQ